MKVKELVKWLKEKDPEDYVGIRDYGQDSGDWSELRGKKYDFESGDLYPNFEILTEKRRNKVLIEQGDLK